MKNLKEFKELIERYETIQLPEIEAAFKIKDCITPQFFTGFGCTITCSLCQSVNDNCKQCVYGYDMACCSHEARDSYTQISHAKMPEELLTAYRNRAKLMRELLKEKGVDDGTGS